MTFDPPEKCGAIAFLVMDSELVAIQLGLKYYGLKNQSIVNAAVKHGIFPEDSTNEDRQAIICEFEESLETLILRANQ